MPAGWTEPARGGVSPAKRPNERERGGERRTSRRSAQPSTRRSMSHLSDGPTLCSGTTTSTGQSSAGAAAAAVRARCRRSATARLRVAHQRGTVLLSASGKRWASGRRAGGARRDVSCGRRVGRSRAVGGEEGGGHLASAGRVDEDEPARPSGQQDRSASPSGQHGRGCSAGQLRRRRAGRTRRAARSEAAGACLPCAG